MWETSNKEKINKSLMKRLESFKKSNQINRESVELRARKGVRQRWAFSVVTVCSVHNKEKIILMYDC
jgi:hypothetical protein